MGHQTIADLAAVLRGTESDLISPRPTDRSATDGLDIRQVGGAVLSEPFPVPVPGPHDPVAPREAESIIETFVVDGPGPAMPTGGDQAVADWWQPTVDQLVDRVRTALAQAAVELAGPIYVAASTTPLDRVIAEPHLDDDQYHPGAGVGLVAIAASHRGPRLARGSLACQPTRPGAPLALDHATLAAWFDDGGSAVQATPADRIVLFPRFGQLHAGPTTAADGPPASEIRNLLVLRADTVADQARAGSGPT